MIELSGGDLGGGLEPDTAWEIGEEKAFEGGLIYRRVSETQAVFVGVEPV